MTEGAASEAQRVRALNERLAVLAGHLNAVNAQLVEATEAMIADGTWQQAAKTSPSLFLQWKIGLSPARADDIVRVAERRADFPVLMAGFDRGVFSLEQIAAAVEAPPWADAKVYDFVTISTVAKIRRGMRSNMFEHDPDEPPAEAKPVRDSVSFGVGRDGRWRMNGNLNLDDGRRIEAALTERKDALFTEGDEDATWADALLDCCERSLDSVASRSRRDRYRTWIHLDTTGDATTTDGWRIPLALREQVLCDGVVQPVWQDEGVPFSVGRSQHIVPDRTRRIIEKRDRGCRVPGCNADRFVEIHHIVHWLNGGPTDTWNLISLCPKHHKMHHRGELGISGNADGFNQVVFVDGNGDRIAGSGRPDQPTGPPPEPEVPYDSPLAGRFDWNWIGLGWVHPNAVKKRLAQVEAHYQRQAARQQAA